MVQLRANTVERSIVAWDTHCFWNLPRSKLWCLSPLLSLDSCRELEGGQQLSEHSLGLDLTNVIKYFCLLYAHVVGLLLQDHWSMVTIEASRLIDDNQKPRS